MAFLDRLLASEAPEAHYYKIMITTASVVEQLVAPLAQKIEKIFTEEKETDMRVRDLTKQVANAEPPAIKKLSAKNDELKKILRGLRKELRSQQADLKRYGDGWASFVADKQKGIAVLEKLIAEKSEEQKTTSKSLRKEKDSATNAAYIGLVKQLKETTKKRQALRKELKTLYATTPSDEDIAAITHDHFGNPVDAAAILTRELEKCWDETPLRLACSLLDKEAEHRGAFWHWRRFVLAMANRESWTEKQREWVENMDESSFLRYPPLDCGFTLAVANIYAAIVFIEQSAGPLDQYLHNPLRRHFCYNDLWYWVRSFKEPPIKTNAHWMVAPPAEFIRSEASRNTLRFYILGWEECQGEVLDGFLGLYDLVRSHDEMTRNARIGFDREGSALTHHKDRTPKLRFQPPKKVDGERQPITFWALEDDSDPKKIMLPYFELSIDPYSKCVIVTHKRWFRKRTQKSAKYHPSVVMAITKYGRAYCTSNFIAKTQHQEGSRWVPGKGDLMDCLKLLNNHPESSASALGKLTGSCCICNSPLSTAESLRRGIGPECNKKYSDVLYQLSLWSPWKHHTFDRAFKQNVWYFLLANRRLRNTQRPYLYRDVLFIVIRELAQLQFGVGLGSNDTIRYAKAASASSTSTLKITLEPPITQGSPKRRKISE